ncbi:MAG: hypothetical protein JO006_14930 [Paucibacter sp.]|nr:hypothetical protein [Roseateles sp.]
MRAFTLFLQITAITAVSAISAGAQALTVSAACMQPADEGTDVFVQVQCTSATACSPAADQISIEFVGMDVGAFPVSRIAWIDGKGRVSLDEPRGWPRQAVWDMRQSFAVDARLAHLSFDNEPLTPNFELRHSCSRLSAAALALLKRAR